MKYEFRLLNDILAKAITVKAGSFDAVTVERFQIMTAIHYGLKVNWGKVLFNVLKDMVDKSQKKAKGFAAQIGVLLKGMPTITMDDGVSFPSAKILSMKTVNTYIATNTTLMLVRSRGWLVISDVAGSKKRVATEDIVPVIPKKRHTVKTKPSFSQASLDIVNVAQDVVPIQEIVKDADAVAVTSTDEADIILAKVFEETLELGVSETERGGQGVDEAVFEEDFARWLDDFVARNSEPEFVDTRIDTRAEGSISPVVDKEMNKPVDHKQVTEATMSIDDLLLQISDDLMLPSITAVELTKIRLGEYLNFGDVQERDLYSASLPRISSHDKGKGILVEGELVRGNPAREMVELICKDVDSLVQLRDQVMVDVVSFFHSFSINKLTNFDALLALKEKEKFMLEWAETDSLETAVKRKMYILAKYKELLLRKFLDSHRQFYTPGQPWTATASQIIDLLTDSHSKSLEDLLAQQREHGLPMDQSCFSTIIDSSVDSGAVLAKLYSVAKSTCWVRPVILVNGVWTPVQGPDFWRSSRRLSLFLNKTEMPAPALHDIFVSTDVFIEPVQYWDAAPSLLKTWRWRDVCTEVIRFSMYGCLRPVFMGLVVYNLGVERLPDYFLDDFQKGVCTDTFVSYFSGSSIQTNSEIGLSSSDGSTVYRSPSPISPEIDSFENDLRFALGPAIFSNVEQEELLYFVQSPESPPAISPHQESSSSSPDVSMHFDSKDIPVNAQVDTQTLAPVDFTMFTDALEDLRSSIFQRIHDSNCEILSKVNAVELGVRGDFLKLQVLLRQSLENACRVLERQDLFDIKKKQREQDAKLIALDEQIAAIRSEQLDFQKKIAADILSLSTQVGDIADYIRGGDAKKGEIGSSIRPSTVRTQTFPPTTGTFAERAEQAWRHIIESGQVISVEEAVERVIEADRRESDRLERERERERRERRQSRSGTYKRRRGY
ncbi:alpha-mannosidase 2x [Dorcoceras hygrometricum]|uniref:Alpha-mannosidase 2x n=1 Tax=Dorcoceras hygrometricum TaxID=472368 RepID=A0A2Z7CFT5_9LAMI|nr:alpha-mannosidase 2x [Dorcoceras hygrometricum]